MPVATLGATSCLCALDGDDWPICTTMRASFRPARHGPAARRAHAVCRAPAAARAVRERDSGGCGQPQPRRGHVSCKVSVRVMFARLRWQALVVVVVVRVGHCRPGATRRGAKRVSHSASVQWVSQCERAISFRCFSILRSTTASAAGADLRRSLIILARSSRQK